MVASVSRYVRTARHLRPWQILGRLVAPARRRWAIARLPKPPASLQAEGALLGVAGRPPDHDPWNSREALLEGRFTFLREEHALGWTPDWHPGRLPLLWQFNLHYFHYLHLLQADEQLALCRSWIEANPEGQGVGWHPYPTSLRIVNWCRVGLREPVVLASLYRQAAYLARNMETHVYGNHLLENARALVVAGAFFGGQSEAPTWVERGLAVLRAETSEQVLPDGGHFERSPMYHALMLEAYLDVLGALPAGHADRAWLEQTARRMGDVLRTLTHPDGGLALFNDATHDIAPAPRELLAYLGEVTGYEPQPRQALPEMGYFVWQRPGAHLIVDGGPVGPSYLMAHAHADVFSYELSLGGHRFVVDSGVYEYPDSPMRDYVRSTKAHNTVSVDGADQVECWGSFRVGQRAAPQDVLFERDSDGCRFRGRFGGYARRLGDGITHRRELTADGRQRRIEVTDVIEGRGRHHAQSRIHFHPEVDIEVADGAVQVHRGGVSCTVAVREGTWRIDEGWYCPEFGLRLRNQVLVIEAEHTLPIRLRYVIDY